MSDMISISAMDKIIKDTFEDTIECDFRGQTLIVKRALSFADMVSFVNDVVSNCFADSGDYLPEVKKFVTDINTVQYYSNVRLPDDIKHKYDILTKTGLVSVIQQLVDEDQYMSIMRSIDEKIRSRVHTNEQLFNNRLNAAMKSIEDLISSIKTSFDGITQDDIKNLMGAINNSKLDEEKLVEAYLKVKEKDDNQAKNGIYHDPEKS